LLTILPINADRGEICLNVSAFFGTSTNWANGIQLNLRSSSDAAGAFQPNQRMSIDEAKEQLRNASAALADAFRKFSMDTKPVYTSSTITTGGTLAALTAQSPHLDALEGIGSTLQTTLKINTQTSTTRSSSSAMGLDLTTAVSRLYSSALGLDVTSAAAASQLNSSASIGLDVTSAESASSLNSSTALGLDLTSADAASQLSSSQTLGLDVTSAQTSSTLKSSAALGLNLTSVQSTVTSTGEMNTAATSYGSTSLAFSGSGTPDTSSGTLSGVYTGVNTAANATSLTVKVLNNATLNTLTAKTLKFEVRDQTGALLFNFNGTAKAGAQIYLGNDIGLSVSFATGTLTQNHTSSTTVSHTPTDVDANATFNNANTNLRPKFENNAQVTAGSFTVNGTSITVNANDTINNVISRINASAAGVTASLANDKITLTSNSASESNITLASDTSGFLSATKLASATTVRGNIRDDQQALSQTAQFGTVSNGSFTINGTSISVNKDTDTLSSVISRINSSTAGVTASYDSAQDKVILSTTSNSEDLITVGGDTSGFLTAARLSTNNTVRGNIRDDQQVLSKTSQFAAVTSGSFSINGQSISVVASSDTLSSLITKINNSGAGVTASYDSTLDKIKLVGTTNSEDLITVSGDNTGFLSAAHLATGNTVRGHLREDGVVLADLSEFQSVTDGSFVIDGKTISVSAASDTIQSLVGKINASGARVAASYDSSTDKILLQGTYNSEDNVPLGTDTSGFLAAAHLDAANTVKGNIRDDQQVLSKTSQFGGVSSGTFAINGKTITIDVAQDSLSTIVGKINAAGAGVTASYNSSTNKIQLVGTSNSEDLITVNNDTTGFLTAAKLSTNNTVRGNIRDDQQVLSKTSQFSSVSTGSFTINGKTISVDASSDSVSSIISAINNANAGVSASYDSTLDKVVFTAGANGRDLITVANDTSGFLAVAGLSTGNTVRGKLADDEEVLSNTSTFSAVTNGTLQINGVSIAVDAGQDTLQTLISKINNAGAGVTASYNNSADKLTFTPDTAGATLSIENDTSGFLAATKVASGTAATHVNADAAFNGSGSNGPLFDPGLAVTAGSFSVNGVSIGVGASDTVNSVLAKITASAAGVTATYDSSAQTIKLTSKNLSADPVTVTGDTSGFLAAVKLDGSAKSTPGASFLSAFDGSLDRMSEYSAVHAGTVTVNGQAIAVDPASTTIRDLVSAFNNVADVTATLDETTGKIDIQSTRAGGAISFSDTSGVLSTLGIFSKTYNGSPAAVKVVQTQTGTTTTSNAETVAGDVSTAANGLNSAIASLGEFVAETPQIRSEVESAVRDAINSLSSAGAQGLSLQGKGTEIRLAVNRTKLASSLDQTHDEIAKALDSFSGNINSFAASRPPGLSAHDIARLQLGPMMASYAASQIPNTLRLLSPPKKAADAYKNQMLLQK
jgi:hypothetical protein